MKIKSTFTVQRGVGFVKNILFKVIKNFAIIVTTLENFAEQHINHVTFFSGSRNMFRFSFITSLVMTLTSSSRAWEKVKNELIVFPKNENYISFSKTVVNGKTKRSLISGLLTVINL